MTQRLPVPRMFANSNAKMSIIYRGKAGQQMFEISPAFAGAIVASAALVATIALGASVYVFSKDSLMRTVLNSHTQMQYAYEDRIAQLRAHLDRVAGRQIIDTDSVETRLQALLSRQMQLENRQTIVGRIAEEASRVGVRYSTGSKQVDPMVTGSVAPTIRPLGAPVKPAPDGVSSSRPEPLDGLRTQRLSELNLPVTRHAIPSLLDNAETRAVQTAQQQLETLRAIEMRAQVSARRYRNALDQTGLDPSRFAKAMPKAIPAGIGGPLVPMTGSEAQIFEKSLAATQTYLRETEGLSKIVRALPIRRPLGKDHETSSTFGGRLDPFTRGMAMHAGLDFRASTGTPIKATADGKVVQADWVGGYGRLVEVDHGFGLTTRYAHMSGFNVGVGDTVKKGAVVGYVGSTGRSTGPHLHYEVRIDEEAVDPMSFLRTGEKAGID